MLRDPEKRAAYDQLGANWKGGQEFRPPPDRHAKIQIDLEDAYHGATRRVTLQVPEIDAQGHGVLREHQIDFVIPRGVRAGQHIRLAGQGARYGTGPAG